MQAHLPAASPSSIISSVVGKKSSSPLGAGEVVKLAAGCGVLHLESPVVLPGRMRSELWTQ